jgi:membrane protein YqaA with SNARE-associated domain
LFPLSTVKNILKRYSAWIWKVLAPLGPWGVFAIAAVDGSLFGMPVDAVVAGYVYNDRARFLFYVVMASAGSALGSSVIYAIGYFGGETVLRKRISEERFNKIHASFERHEFWALMFPAMLPPPTPFKLFVLAASAFEMRFTHFLAAVFAGRFVRFFVLAVLTIEFGPQFVHLVGSLVRQHLGWVLAAVAVAIVLGLFLWLRRRNHPPAGESPAVEIPGKITQQ